MHIVLVCREYVGSARGGGIGSYMHEIARAYVKIGHKVTVVTASDDTLCESTMLSSDGIRVISLSGGDFFVPGIESGSKFKKLRFLYRFHSYRRKLVNVISNINDADIVEVADYGAEGLYLSQLKIPVVVRLHTPQSLSISNFERIHPKWWKLHRSLPIAAETKIFENARYITGCSQAILDWVGNNYDISQAKAAVIKNPVSISGEINQSKNFNNSKFKTIFFAGTISETKGVGDLIEAINILRTEGFEFKLKLAGKGGSFQTVLQKKVAFNRWDWIEFLGKLPRKEVYRNYIESDICCFPSWWENMPMVVIESMALGAIVVSTDAGGTGEIITDGIDGFLCERCNPYALASSLKKAISLSENECAKMAYKAKLTAINKFNTDKIASEMLSFFNNVIIDFKNNNQ